MRHFYCLNRVIFVFLKGVAAAKLRGAYRGRKKSIDIEEVKRLSKEEQLGATKIAQRLGIGRASVYRALLADNGTV